MRPASCRSPETSSANALANATSRSNSRQQCITVAISSGRVCPASPGTSHRLVLATECGRFAAFIDHPLQFALFDHRARANLGSLQAALREPCVKGPFADSAQTPSGLRNRNQSIQSSLPCGIPHHYGALAYEAKPVYCNSQMDVTARELRDKFAATRRGRKDHAEVSDVRLLRHFNERPKDSRVQRVIQLIELLQEANRLEERLWEAYSSGKQHRDYDQKFASNWRFTAPEIQAINIRHSRTLHKVDSLLRHYWWQPVVRSNGAFEGLRAYTWPGESGKAVSWENLAVHFVLDLVSRRLLQLIRRCRQCKAWFCAVTNHQVSCGDNCRKKFSSTSAEFKEKRKLYMRYYRSQEEKLDQRAKRLARQKGR